MRIIDKFENLKVSGVREDGKDIFRDNYYLSFEKHGYHSYNAIITDSDYHGPDDDLTGENLFDEYYDKKCKHNNIKAVTARYIYENEMSALARLSERETGPIFILDYNNITDDVITNATFSKQYYFLKNIYNHNDYFFVEINQHTIIEVGRDLELDDLDNYVCYRVVGKFKPCPVLEHPMQHPELFIKHYNDYTDDLNKN